MKIDWLQYLCDPENGEEMKLKSEEIKDDRIISGILKSSNLLESL